MRSRGSAIALWLLAAVAATWLVWEGVGSIRTAGRTDAAVVAAPVPATANESADLPDPTPTATVDTPVVGSRTESPTGSGLESSTPEAEPASPTPSASGPAPSTGSGSGGGTSNPAPTVAAPPTPASEPAPTTTPTTTPQPTSEPVPTTAPAPVVQSFNLVGGSATVQFSPTAVTVLAATPRSGFVAEVSQNGATQVRVEFESDDHRSRLDARWDDGPVHEIDED